MSRVIYFDCPSGAAGDMIMAALVDAGAPFEALRDGLHGLDLGAWDLVQHEVRRGDFRATKVDVQIDAAAHHHHRGLGDILAILEGSRLPASVAASARRIFERLAQAEARVHGTTPEHVRFHDVGAVDAIVDVTGGALGLHLLGIDTVYVSPLPLGGGFVDGPHGRMPIPGPGTVELLRGFPVVDTGVRFELVTPARASRAGGRARPAAMPLGAVGDGARTRDLPGPPTVRRSSAGEPAAASGATETIVQVETPIDEMSPRLYEPLVDRLFEAGALDV